MEFELVYYDITVLHVTQCTTGTPLNPERSCLDSSLRHYFWKSINPFHRSTICVEIVCQTDCVSLCANALDKSMNPSFSLAMSK